MTFSRAAVVCLLLLAGTFTFARQQNADWPLNGGVGNARFSPLTQITRDIATSIESHR